MSITSKEFYKIKETLKESLIDINYIEFNGNSIIQFITPMLDNSNDHIEIFLLKQNNRWIFSDLGNTLDKLLEEDVNIKMFPYNKMFKKISYRYDIKLGIENSIFKIIKWKEEKEFNYNLKYIKSEFNSFLTALHNLYTLSDIKDIFEIFNKEIKHQYKEISTIHMQSVKNLKLIQKKNKIEIKQTNIIFIIDTEQHKYNLIKQKIKQALLEQILNTDDEKINILLDSYIKKEIIPYITLEKIHTIKGKK